MHEYWHMISEEYQQKLKTIAEGKSVSPDTAMRNIINFLKHKQSSNPVVPEYFQELITARQIEETIDMISGNAGGDLDLAQESCGAQPGRDLVAEDLDRDLAMVLHVLGQMDGRHAALPQLSLEAIAVGESGGQAGKGVRHRRQDAPEVCRVPARRLADPERV